MEGSGCGLQMRGIWAQVALIKTYHMSLPSLQRQLISLFPHLPLQASFSEWLNAWSMWRFTQNRHGPQLVINQEINPHWVMGACRDPAEPPASPCSMLSNRLMPPERLPAPIPELLLLSMQSMLLSNCLSPVRHHGSAAAASIAPHSHWLPRSFSNQIKSNRSYVAPIHSWSHLKSTYRWPRPHSLL